LIVGAGGFVGHHLIKILLAYGNTVFATKLQTENMEDSDCTVMDLNIADEQKIKDVLYISNPDVIFHLVALSSVFLSWLNIKKTFEVNTIGAINLLNCKHDGCISYKPKLYQLTPRITIFSARNSFFRLSVLNI
jgi:CDP-glucose 4,6-dehydratase